MTIEIHLFGELTVVRDGHAIVLPASKKTRALLAYLAATARPQLREKLCSLLWDGPDDPRAALRWSLTKLRPVVDEPEVRRLVADREHVQLEPVDACVDLAMLRSAIPGGVPSGAARASTEVLRSVAPLVRGGLLEGLELPDCSRFVEWCRAERDLARRLGAACWRRSSIASRMPTTMAGSRRSSTRGRGSRSIRQTKLRARRSRLAFGGLRFFCVRDQRRGVLLDHVLVDDHFVHATGRACRT